MKDNYDIKTRYQYNTPAQIAHALVEALLSATQFAPICSFFSNLAMIQWRLRREIWEAEFTKRLDLLENIKNIPDSVSIFASYFQASMLDVEDDKVKNYVNAAVNSILNEDVTKTKIHIFLNILRDFTVAHIMLLEHILQLESEGKTSNEPFEEGTFPNEVTKELRDNLLEDLYYYKLVDIRNSNERQFDLAITAKTFPKYVTKLGKEFLDFISEHE